MKVIAILVGALVELLWLGHPALRITSPGSKVTVIVPPVAVMPVTPPERPVETLGETSIKLFLPKPGETIEF